MNRLISFVIAIILILSGCPAFSNTLAEGSDPEGDNVMTALSDTQRNSIGVLNYLAYLTKEIESQKENRLYLESAYSSLYNNTYMNAIDAVTLGQVKSLLTALNNFKMLTVKRERLEYIYEQNQAQAIHDAIPSPLAVMNVIQSGSWQKALVSIVYMAVDSISSYYSSKGAADMQFLQNGWELDDEETAILHNGHLDSLEYMWEIVHDYDLPGDLAINEDDIDRFVEWKNNTNLAARIQFLESNREVYQAFGEYWLVLAESYYDHGDMTKCLDAIKSYETYSTRIFRKDYHYAKVLPLAITAASETYVADQYVSEASRFANRILKNCDQEDWVLRYFAAVTYVELAGQTSDDTYLHAAYDIALNNTNYLVQKQIVQNREYMAEIVPVDVPADATESKRQEIETYNKGQQEARKKALPPISDALVLNGDLLFSLADQLDISEGERTNVNDIIFGHRDVLFLNPLMDRLYRLDQQAEIPSTDIEIDFDGKEIKLPACYLTDTTTISVGGLDTQGKIFSINDWTIQSVNRTGSADVNTFMAVFTSNTASSFPYTDGSTVWINLNPSGDDHTAEMQITFKVTSQKEFLKSRLTFQRIDG